MKNKKSEKKINATYHFVFKFILKLAWEVKSNLSFVIMPCVPRIGNR